MSDLSRRLAIQAAKQPRTPTATLLLEASEAIERLESPVSYAWKFGRLLGAMEVIAKTPSVWQDVARDAVREVSDAG